VLPGFSGHLVSEFFLERRLRHNPLDMRTDALRRTLNDWRRRCRTLGPASSVRAVFETGAEPFVNALGFARSGPIAQVDLRGEALAATIRAGTEPVVLIVASWGDPLDLRWRAGIEHAARAGAAWSLLFNGTDVRLVDAGRLYSRRHVEFDIDLALENVHTFAALSTLLVASAFSREMPAGRTPIRLLVDASARHSTGVCQSLRSGVSGASTDVLGALLSRSRSADVGNAYEQALTIVYRMLFLLFAEARHLVPIWHPVYRESYSLESLCDIAERGPSPAGLWDALRAVSRIAHSGCRAGDLLVTAFNGRLFSPSRAPLADHRDLDDEAAKRALLALSTRAAADGQGRERIAYRDLGVEELGGVYEHLLDYEPKVESVRRSAEHPYGLALSLARGRGLRKATGTFYTPQPIAEYLVRQTIGPLAREATPERILAMRVLDPSMGSGAFLVASCRFLADAYETALVRHASYHPTDFGPAERIAIRRTIAERCLFGVDLNPMAVQLSRLSLWLATLAADRPLSFLDHHLACGDSLIGAWLVSLGRPPQGTRRRSGSAPCLPLFDGEGLTDAMRLAVPVRFSLAATPNNTASQVRDKERALAGLNARDAALSKWKRVADLWCAGWFASPRNRAPASAFGALSDAILTGQGALPDAVSQRYLAEAEAVAARQQLFHWELEFPEAFFDATGRRRADGGFDAVVGNPPWDMVRGDAGPADERADARDAANAVVRFTRDSGVYTSQSAGHANRYQLFVERVVALARPGGRIGLVLPAGLAADHGSGPLRRLLFSRCAVDRVVGFDNTARIFPIHQSVRFLVATATTGTPTTSFGCRLGERDPAVLDADDAVPICLSPSLLERLSGHDLAIPDVRTPMDLGIVERAAALFPPLGDEHGWGARFGRELNASDDRAWFRPPGTIDKGLPVLEGKDIEPFRVNADRARSAISERHAAQLLAGRYDRARLAYRDVASPTNRVTLIAAVLPPQSVSTHTLFCLRTLLALRHQHLLCGLFNSFVVNYLVRLRVSTHVTTAIVERLPIPTLDHCPGALADVAAIARLLRRRADAGAFARLNALVAEIYQLTRDEFAHVLGTFPIVPRENRDRAMAMFLSRVHL
jgi:hypothetical protein